MTLPPEEIAAKMDALGLWDALERCNWALKPNGSALPYFCTVVKDRSGGPVKLRLLLLEGWQTLHDYVHLQMDANFGFYSSPFEMPHFCVAVRGDGAVRAFRHDTGYAPRAVSAQETPLVQKLLWQVYGVMMRLESDRNLPMRYAAEKAMFARVETSAGQWEDAPLEIPRPRAYVEKITFSREDAKAAQDLPFAGEMSVELDFRLIDGVVTAESRARTVYVLAAVDSASGEAVFRRSVSVGEGGLKGLWESVPSQILKEFVRLGRVPGRIKLVSGRLFRMVRALCIELPFKLSLHDSLPALESAFAGMSQGAAPIDR